MRYSKLTVILFSIFLVLTIVIFGIDEMEWDGTVSITAVLNADGHTEEIKCWQKSSNEYFLFLPSYAKLSEVSLRTYTNSAVWLGDYRLDNSKTCDFLELNIPYSLVYNTRGREYSFSLTFLQSKKIPTIYIDVPSGNMEYIHAMKGNEEFGEITVYTDQGQLDYVGKLDSIKGRGNFTWNFPKKSYSLSMSAEADILGMGKAQKWILLSNANDASLMRNKIVYDFSRLAGLPFSPDCEWVDLYLNGEYAGLYLLSERNEIHKERVDIPQEGSFLVSQELEERLIAENNPYVFTKGSRAMRIHFSSISNDEVEGIWQSISNAILSEDGIDIETGCHWTELIDVDSWVMRYLIDECFGNYDGGYISQFFYWNGEQRKMYAGPVWDMDNTLACGGWLATSPNAILAARSRFRSVEDEALFYALCNREDFQNRVQEIYQSTFVPLFTNLLDVRLEQYISQIAQASKLDQIRWNVQDTEESINKIRNYLVERIEFLDDYWENKEEYCVVEVSNGYEIWACFAIRPGEYLPELPSYTNGNWCIEGTDIAFNIEEPIYQNVAIYWNHET